MEIFPKVQVSGHFQPCLPGLWLVDLPLPPLNLTHRGSQPPGPCLSGWVFGHTFRPTGSAHYFCFREDYHHGDGCPGDRGRRGARNPPVVNP